MDTVHSRQIMKTKTITLRGFFISLFYIHMLLLFFQIPIRDLFLDITVWRDLVLILICIIWFIYVMAVRKFLMKPTGMDIAILLLVFYGVINFSINITRGSNVLEAVTYFRNHFSPFVLYFPAAYAFKNTEDQRKFIKFLSIIFIIYISTPIIESLIKLSGLSLSWIPWYHYAFSHGDRFEQSGGYIKAEDSPIIGLLSFPHYTVVPIIAIFALIYPFMFTSGNKHLKIEGNNFTLINISFLKYFYIVLLIISMLLFQVRTHLISFFVALFIFAPPQLKKSKYLITAVIIFPLIFFLFSLLSGTSNIFEQFINGFVSESGGDTSLSVLLSLNDVQFVVQSKLFNLFFGHGYNEISGTTFDLIANSTGWEIKLVYYTAIYGLLWLILILTLCIFGFYYSKKNAIFFPVNSFEYNFALGFKVMMIVLLIDACHYMRMMSWPTLDMWIICLSILAVNYKKITFSQSALINL
jgi:hypothetical protein